MRAAKLCTNRTLQVDLHNGRITVVVIVVVLYTYYALAVGGGGIKRYRDPSVCLVVQLP